MRVLHVISSGGMYGAEAVILQLMRAGAEGGDESAVAIFDNRSAPNEEFAEAAGRAGVRVERVVCEGQMDRRVPGRIWGLARGMGAEVVHAHGYKADLYTWAGLRGGGVALVSTCHTWYDNGLAVRVYGALDRGVLRDFDGVVAVSEEVRERLLRAGVRAERTALIANGLEVGPYAGMAAGVGRGETPVVGLGARLAREKGVDVFLRMAAGVRAERPEARFAVWGEGPERASLERLRGELGLENVVAMPGRREDMVEALEEMDVWVSASRQEGLPMALLEAMAAGRAVVATAVGEVPGVVEDGRTGYLVGSEDVEGMVRRVEELLGDEGRRRAMGEAARSEVRGRFGAEAMMRRYRAVYEGAMARAAKRRRVLS